MLHIFSVIWTEKLKIFSYLPNFSYLQPIKKEYKEIRGSGKNAQGILSLKALCIQCD